MSEGRKFKATILKQPEPIIVLDTSEYVDFIVKNSEMDWNTVCEFIYKKGYLDHDIDKGIDDYEEPCPKRVADHGCDYEYEFAQAHPWSKEIYVTFQFND